MVVIHLKQIMRFAKKALVVCVILVVAVAFEGCGEVADQTLEELKDIPSQLFATSETAEPGTAETAEPDYDHIYYRHNNQWVIAKLVKYEIVDGGLNIKFEVEDTMSGDKDYYTSMANVMLIHSEEHTSRNDYALYPGNKLN
jgi:hypothetical protein